MHESCSWKIPAKKQHSEQATATALCRVFAPSVNKKWVSVVACVKTEVSSSMWCLPHLYFPKLTYFQIFYNRKVHRWVAGHGTTQGLIHHRKEKGQRTAVVVGCEWSEGMGKMARKLGGLSWLKWRDSGRC